jgi:phage terminase large subunit GpA-like protein
MQDRQESYDHGSLPDGVVIITAGVDVQNDRLEVEFVGWGVGEESWSIDYVILNGDPTRPALWDRLDDELTRRFRHQTFGQMANAITFIDSSFMTDVVYRYCHQRRGVYAIQGVSSQTGQVKPIVPPKKKQSKKGLFVRVGVDVAKDVIYARLRFGKPGPGYCHFPDTYSPEYFDQLTAEEKRTKFLRNRPVKYWYLPKGKRNEALDCRVYAFAALRFIAPNLSARRAALEKIGERIKFDLPQQSQPKPQRRVRSHGVQ